MAIQGIDRDRFEAVLKEKLSPTTPIRTPEALKGREKILEEVRRSFVQPGRHVFIHGDRGVGKTSLAQTAAIQHQSSDGAPIFIGCDNASTFYGVARNISQKLASGDPTVSKVTKSLGGGWRGFISAEATKTVKRGVIPEFRSIDEAVSIIGYLANKHSQQPVIVVDEFERITSRSRARSSGGPWPTR